MGVSNSEHEDLNFLIGGVSGHRIDDRDVCDLASLSYVAREDERSRSCNQTAIGVVEGARIAVDGVNKRFGVVGVFCSKKDGHIDARINVEGRIRDGGGGAIDGLDGDGNVGISRRCSGLSDSGEISEAGLSRGSKWRVGNNERGHDCISRGDRGSIECCEEPKRREGGNHGLDGGDVSGVSHFEEDGDSFVGEGWNAYIACCGCKRSNSDGNLHWSRLLRVDGVEGVESELSAI